MKTQYAIAVVACLALLLSGASAVAEDEDSSAGPFSFQRQRKAPTSTNVSDAPTSGWKWPRLWPVKTTTTVASRKAAKPSTWQKLNNGTKSFLSETADTLNPFNDADDNKPPATITGSSSMFRQASKKQETKSKSFLPSWPWGGEDEESKDKTVNEFLMRPRPDFE